MNCDIIKEKMWDLLDEHSPENQATLHHINQCEKCKAEYLTIKETIAMLKPNVEFKSSAELPQKILNAVNTRNNGAIVKPLTNNKWKKYVAIAAVILVLLVTIPIVNFITGNNSNALTAASSVFAKHMAIASNIKTMIISLKIRTYPADNFDVIDVNQNFVTHTICKTFTPTEKWKIQKEGRTVVMDGKNMFLFASQNQNYMAVKGSTKCGFVNWIKILLNPSKIIENEKNFAAKNKAQYTITETDSTTVVTVVAKALGDFTNDYLLNSSIPESNNRRVYAFNKATGLLKSLQVFVQTKQSEVEVLKVENIQYNVDITEDTYSIKIPENVSWQDVDVLAKGPESGYTKISSEEAAKKFFNACASENINEAKKFLPVQNNEIFKMLGKLTIVSIGKSFKSGDYPGEFVPYEIKLQSGQSIKQNLALRNDNKNKVWLVDGGL